MADIQRIALQHKIKKKRVHRKSHGKYTFQELSKMIAKSWKDLPHEQKQLFEAQAVVEREERDQFIEATRQRALISATMAQQQEQRRGAELIAGREQASKLYLRGSSSTNTSAILASAGGGDLIMALRSVDLTELLQLRDTIDAEINARCRQENHQDSCNEQTQRMQETLQLLLSRPHPPASLEDKKSNTKNHQNKKPVGDAESLPSPRLTRKGPASLGSSAPPAVNSIAFDEPTRSPTIGSSTSSGNNKNYRNSSEEAGDHLFDNSGTRGEDMITDSMDFWDSFTTPVEGEAVSTVSQYSSFSGDLDSSSSCQMEDEHNNDDFDLGFF